jgi:predicted small secreted protein
VNRALTILPARLALSLVALAVLTLSGCGTSGGGDDVKKEPDVNDRPTMETMVARYEQLRDDLFRELDERFGSKPWAESANSPGMSRSGCAEDDEGEHVHLPGMSFQGAYPAADWHQVQQVVEEVGAEHGFDDVAVVTDEPGNLYLVAEDEFGARLQFGMARNTTFGLRTGCHRWESKPPPSP